jgi:hypothetical protein
LFAPAPGVLDTLELQLSEGVIIALGLGLPVQVTLELPKTLADAALEFDAKADTEAVAAMLLLALAVAEGTAEMESVAGWLLLVVGTLAICDAVAVELCVLEREEVPLTDPAASPEREGRWKS